MELAQQKQSSACVLKYLSFCHARFISNKSLIFFEKKVAPGEPILNEKQECILSTSQSVNQLSMVILGE